MKKSVQQMQQILEEIKTIKKDLIRQEPVKEIWVGGIEVQSTLFISERTLYRHRKSGRLPYSKVRGKIYYKKMPCHRGNANDYPCYFAATN